MALLPKVSAIGNYDYWDNARGAANLDDKFKNDVKAALNQVYAAREQGGTAYEQALVTLHDEEKKFWQEKQRVDAELVKADPQSKVIDPDLEKNNAWMVEQFKFMNFNTEGLTRDITSPLPQLTVDRIYFNDSL